MRKNQQGFGPILLIFTLLIVGVVGGAGWFVWRAHQKPPATQEPAAKTTLLTLTSYALVNTPEALPISNTIVIYTDGSGQMYRGPNGGQSFAEHNFDAAKLQSELADEDLRLQSYRNTCNQSSTGNSTVRLEYNSITDLNLRHISVGGVDCYLKTYPERAFSKDLDQIIIRTGL